MTCSPPTTGSRSPTRTSGEPTRSRPCTIRASSSSSRGRGPTIRSFIPAPTTWCPTCSPVPACSTASGRYANELPVVAELGRWCFETTTPLTEGTYEAARGAVDIALSATQLVLDGADHAYGLCRPPGHHAPRALYGGYCFFNNAAVAAHHVASTTGSRVTVLDVDYHHGNGTQQIFYGRDDVQYVSLHGDPRRAYPVPHRVRRRGGHGAGEGSEPQLPARRAPRRRRLCRRVGRRLSRDRRVRSRGRRGVARSRHVPRRPDLGSRRDADGFRRQGALVGELGRPTVVLQEGGYDVATLGANARAWLLGLAARGAR